ncbi:MAG: amidophosphoribosyltransferase [Patescibacteria group bacterium]
MCGIIGIFSHQPVAEELHDGLIHLQHRGQDAAGVCTYNQQFHIVKGSGFVKDVFNQQNIQLLNGNWGIGHTRYGTAGGRSAAENAQPFMIQSPYGIAMAHNGDLTNYTALKKDLAENDRRHCNSTSDLELILHVFAAKLDKLDPRADFFENLCQAALSVFDRCVGGYSVVGMIAEKGMIALRDPHGIRPFTCGMRINADGAKDYIFSSENTMYYPLGFKHMGNVQQGELVYINEKGEMQSRVLRQAEFTPDIFEYVYLARPDAMINNVSVYRARLRMGQNLAKRWKEKHPNFLPDIVIPIPFSSNTAALALAHEIGVRYSEGLYKNIFIGRTFIMPGQEKRKKSILLKLSPQEVEIKNRKVMLVDDSIVRGNTSKEVIDLVRHAGAKEIYFVSACPPVKYPDFYGLDIPTRAELIAANKSEEEIRQFIGADILLYQTIPDLVEAVTRRGEHNIARPSMPYLDGWYVTGDIDEERMVEMEKEKRCV